MKRSKAGDFAMPGGSWDTIKRIIQAYYAAHGDEESTVESIARLAGISRPVISRNNNFLRYIGVVDENQYRLTAAGVRLAVGLAKKDERLVTQGLQEIIDGTEPLKRIVKVVQARGAMSEDALRTEAMIALGLNEKSPGHGYLRTLIDLLQESGVLVASGGEISFHGFYVGEMKGVAGRQADQNPEPLSDRGVESRPPGTKRVPIPLGPDRLAHLELPEDWQPKDLSKLLKMIELALGDEGGH